MINYIYHLSKHLFIDLLDIINNKVTIFIILFHLYITN